MEDIPKTKETKTKIDGKKHLLTTYGWYCTVFLFALILVFNEAKHITSEIHSAKRLFNETEDPKYFIHLTDVHIAKNKEKSEKNFNNSLSFAKEIKTNTIVITGDLTDNWYHYPLWKEAHQNANDHDLYRNLINETASRIEQFIDTSGNHDMFGVYSFNSTKKEFIRTSHFFTEEEELTYENFTLSKCKTSDGINYVIINPVIFPSSKALVDLFYPAPVELLNRIEEMLMSLRGQGPVVLLNHYPAYQWFDIKSKYGHTFREMNQIYDINIALSGHTHPTTPSYVHHDQNLEVVGTDVINHKGLGIVSVDNGNTVYSEFKIDDKPKAIITNPVPSNSLTKHDVFNENDIDIRAVVFSNSNVSISVYEMQKKIGEMQFVRTIREGVHLYHLKNKFEDGHHVINFDGYYKGNLHFFVGNTLMPYVEYTGSYYNLLLSPTPIFFSLFTIFFIILFPFNVEACSKKCTVFSKKCLEWMYKSGISCSEGIMAYVFGYMFIRWRIQSLPILIRLLLFVGLFSPLIFPVVIQSIEGHYGVITSYGYYNSGILRTIIGGDIFRLAHIWFIEAPAVFLCSLFYDYQKYRKLFTIEFFNVGFGLVFCIFFSMFKISETTRIWFTLTGPVFILWPLFMYACIGFWRRFSNRENARELYINTKEDQEEPSSEEEENYPFFLEN